jgi:hypothetical protein
LSQGQSSAPQNVKFVSSFVILVEGLATGLMWTAQGTYATTIAMDYHKLVGETMDKTLSNLFGIFCMAFQSTQVWGNLISSLVFQQTKITKEETNLTFCGAEDCPWDKAN